MDRRSVQKSTKKTDSLEILSAARNMKRSRQAVASSKRLKYNANPTF